MKLKRLEDDPEYVLFILTHYTIEKKQSFIPIWTRGEMVFPVRTSIAKKRLTLIEKLKYYINDFKLYLKLRRAKDG